MTGRTLSGGRLFTGGNEWITSKLLDWGDLHNHAIMPYLNLWNLETEIRGWIGMMTRQPQTYFIVVRRVRAYRITIKGSGWRQWNLFLRESRTAVGQVTSEPKHKHRQITVKLPVAAHWQVETALRRGEITLYRSSGRNEDHSPVSSGRVIIDNPESPAREHGESGMVWACIPSGKSIIYLRFLPIYIGWVA